MFVLLWEKIKIGQSIVLEFAVLFMYTVRHIHGYCTFFCFYSVLLFKYFVNFLVLVRLRVVCWCMKNLKLDKDEMLTFQETIPFRMRKRFNIRKTNAS